MTDDAYRGRGIASLVLQHLVRMGKEDGVAAIFEADGVRAKQAVRLFFRRSGLLKSARRRFSPKSSAGYRYVLRN